MHTSEPATPVTRSAVIAFLCSVAAHFGAIVLIGQDSHQALRATTAVLNILLTATMTRASDNDSAFSMDAERALPEPESATTAAEGEQRRSDTRIPPEAPQYFPSSEVDVPAEPISRPNIVYPEHAMLSRLSGTVRARIFIDLDGRVNSIEILELRPPYVPFEEIAINALIETRFAPAKRFGKTVNSQKVVEVHFNPYEDTVDRRQ